MIEGKNYVMKSRDFEFEFTYGKTRDGKVISAEGVMICDIKEVQKLNIKIDEK